MTARGDERIAALKPGETVDVAHYRLTFDGLFNRSGPNYRDLVGHFTVRRTSGDLIGAMEPGRRTFPARASTGPPCWSANAAATSTAASIAAASKRCAAPRRSPRFHPSSGPNGIVSKSGTNSGPNVELKNGGPTEIFSPVKASSASAEPDHQHLRLEVEAHRNSAVGVWVAERKVELAHPARHQRSFGRRHVAARALSCSRCQSRATANQPWAYGSSSSIRIARAAISKPVWRDRSGISAQPLM